MQKKRNLKFIHSRQDALRNFVLTKRNMRLNYTEKRV